jgi:hypothetical protein
MLGQPQGKNAFDVLQRLEGVRLDRHRNERPNVSDLEGAAFDDPKALSEFTDYLAVFDEAATCESYVAMRRWEDGLVVLFPEYSSIKKAAQLAEGRGHVKQRDGDVAGALDEAEKILRIAAFVRSERHLIAVLVSQSIEALAYRLIFATAPKFGHGDWLRAQKLIGDTAPPLKVREWLVGDMVMFNETVRAVCEGTKEGRELLDAAATERGVARLPNLTTSQSALIRADSLLAWKNVLESTSSSVEHEAGDVAYNELLGRTVMWTLNYGFPPEVAKMIEQLGPETVFRGAYLRDVRGEIVRKAFKIAWQKDWPANGSRIESTEGLQATYMFKRTAVGFSLTYSGGERPVEVFYPTRP